MMSVAVKRIVDIVDYCIANGSKKIMLGPCQYRTFMRMVFGRVTDSRFCIYNGVMIGRWVDEKEED